MTPSRFDTTALNKALIGFDSVFNNLEKRFANQLQTNYPPYNLLKNGEDEYILEIAVTGFSKDEISIRVENSELVIVGDSTNEDNPDITYLHRGLATRNFERRFTLSEHMEVGDAEIANGMLRVYTKRIIPEALKPRSIEIKG